MVSLLTLGLAAVFSSPDEKAITMAAWAKAVPADVVATAAGELAGTTTSATYGAPYNHQSPVRRCSASRCSGGAGCGCRRTRPTWSCSRWRTSRAAACSRGRRSRCGAPPSPAQQARWATNYADALAKAPGQDPAKVRPGVLRAGPGDRPWLHGPGGLGGLEGSLTSSGNFYGGDQTRSLLLLSDGAYLEDLAVAQHLGGDQWGMMNETGNYPGQPWMWLYTFWYQVKPFSTSENADAQVWALMMVLTLGLMFLPLIPGLRDIPRWIPVHRLIWRDYYRAHPRKV